MAKQKFGREVIQSVIEKNQTKRREIAQLTIKIDAKLDEALAKLSNALNISKNRLIEDILMESGIIQEVEENYDE
ncbi:MAG: ribbon-helix-helix protein, CopG family [Sulfurospirillum sp.]|nr:ribbon-helix-helix protein, CopG family [Sulfurospirillum sp.]MBP9492913.1 ribbon-helix-helix protein, CopG family [Sulfurospirillum sp.]MBP9613449.1 ribbon-helix-helix protein, CopG family [Sulfurospirillum sp.]